jgi:hypothetical protein
MMKAKWILGIAAAGVAAALLWRETTGPSADGAVAAALPASADAARSASGSGVVGGKRGDSLLAPAPAAPVTPVRLTLLGELSVAKSYKPLYDRLSNSPEGQTADGQYALYRILRACANVTDRRFRGPRPGTDLQQQRDFVATLPDTDPNKPRRMAALEQLGEDQCVGISGIVTTEAELAKRLADAAAAGSPGARATQIEQEMWAERRGQGGRTAPTLSETQIDSLRAALGSKDPDAMITAGRVLSNSFRDVAVRVGPDQTPIEGRALVNAFAIMACDYGMPCGDNNMRVLNACAYQGHCAAGNLPDYLRYYVSSPNDSALMEQYRSVFRQAIETGNWSAVTFARGPTTASMGSSFFSPPGR